MPQQTFTCTSSSSSSRPVVNPPSEIYKTPLLWEIALRAAIEVKKKKTTTITKSQDLKEKIDEKRLVWFYDQLIQEIYNASVGNW